MCFIYFTRGLQFSVTLQFCFIIFIFVLFSSWKPFLKNDLHNCIWRLVFRKSSLIICGRLVIFETLTFYKSEQNFPNSSLHLGWGLVLSPIQAVGLDFAKFPIWRCLWAGNEIGPWKNVIYFFSQQVLSEKRKNIGLSASGGHIIKLLKENCFVFYSFYWRLPLFCNPRTLLSVFIFLLLSSKHH